MYYGYRTCLVLCVAQFPRHAGRGRRPPQRRALPATGGDEGGRGRRNSFEQTVPLDRAANSGLQTGEKLL